MGDFHGIFGCDGCLAYLRDGIDWQKFPFLLKKCKKMKNAGRARFLARPDGERFGISVRTAIWLTGLLVGPGSAAPTALTVMV
jgi:hypothetical protein